MFPQDYQQFHCWLHHPKAGRQGVESLVEKIATMADEYTHKYAHTHTHTREDLRWRRVSGREDDVVRESGVL